MTNPLQLVAEDSIHSADHISSSSGITKYCSQEDGTIYSVYPPTAFLSFGYWYFMVPPFKPKSMLMLGYAGGTVAGLVRLLYGDVPITGVDIAPIPDNRYNVDLVQADAQQFVKYSRNYEVVLVDLFIGRKSASFLTDDDFIANLKRITDRMLIVLADPTVNIGIYEQTFTRIRMIELDYKICFFQHPDKLEDFFVHW